MTTHRQNSTTASDYDSFVAELTLLTRKYGVALQSVGGVYLANHHGEFSNIRYVADISSGDIYPIFPGCE